MPLYLVRHAKAGSRHDHDGPDVERPLTAAGMRQADAIADRFDSTDVTTVLSSPYLRCVQTVAPLAARRGLTVVPLAMLREGKPFEPVLALLAATPDGTVACTHGDVLPDVITALARRGTLVEGPLDERKGVVWVLEREGREVARAYAIPPP